MTEKRVWLFKEGNADMRNLLGGKGASLLNSIKLRMPHKCFPAVRLRVIKSVVKRVTAQTHS